MKITPQISIDERELEEQFVRASGPGGQNVNKVSTAVELRFNVYTSPSLPDGVRTRLIKLAGKRISSTGDLVINAQRFRTQVQNRADARKRLVDLVRTAAVVPKRRKKSGPSRAAMERRMHAKRQRSETKRARSKRPSDE